MKKEYKEEEENELHELREPAIAYGKQKLTIEEYLEFERASLHEKHEYYKGEIFTMQGAGIMHEVIFTNVFAPLGIKLLKGKTCRPFGSNSRLHIPENTLFTYPDISIFCGNKKHLDEEEDSGIGPSVIIEILSPSTKLYNRGKKFELYKFIPQLKEYIMIDSKSMLVEAWRINEAGIWELEKYTNPKEKLEIKTVQFKISLKDIYEDVSFKNK